MDTPPRESPLRDPAAEYPAATRGILPALKTLGIRQRMAIIAAATVCVIVGIADGPSTALVCVVTLGLVYLSIKVRWSRTQTALSLLHDLASKDPLVRDRAGRTARRQGLVNLLGGILLLLLLIALVLSR